MLVVGGESLIDMVPERKGDGTLDKVPHQGGSPYNCAIALSRLGNPTGFLCPISTDRFGTFLLEPLHAAGVEVLLKQRVDAPTTIADVLLDADGKARYEFRRGADHTFSAEGLIAALPERIEMFQIGGFCPIEPQDAAAWREVVRVALERGATISIDPNVRPSLVSDFESYKARLGAFLDLAHLIKVSEEDLLALEPSLPLAAHAISLLDRPNCELVVVTLGEKGSLAYTASGQGRAGIYAPPVFGDTVGAGDSLMAGILTLLGEDGQLAPERMRLLDGPALDRLLRFGAVVAGLNCAQQGCKPPTRPEVDAVLRDWPTTVAPRAIL